MAAPQAQKLGHGQIIAHGRLPFHRAATTAHNEVCIGNFEPHIRQIRNARERSVLDAKQPQKSVAAHIGGGPVGGPNEVARYSPRVPGRSSHCML